MFKKHFTVLSKNLVPSALLAQDGYSSALFPERDGLTSPLHVHTHTPKYTYAARNGPQCLACLALYLPIDCILVPLQGVIDSRSHAGRHDIGVRGMGSIVLAGMQWRPVVQMVYRGDRPGGVRVSIHGSRYPYSVHPAVMRQLIVLSKRKWARKGKK